MGFLNGIIIKKVPGKFRVSRRSRLSIAVRLGAQPSHSAKIIIITSFRKMQ